MEEFTAKSVDFIKFTGIRGNAYKRCLQAAEEPLFLMKEGNHRVIINRVGDNGHRDSYVYN